MPRRTLLRDGGDPFFRPTEPDFGRGGCACRPTTAPFWGKGMVKALQADAVPAFNHALVRDRALDPRNSV